MTKIGIYYKDLYVTMWKLHMKQWLFFFGHCTVDCQQQYCARPIFTMQGWRVLLTAVWIIYFCLSVNCGVDSVFTVSVGSEGGLSRRLRKQMSTLQRLICLIRLAAPSIPTFIYLLIYLLSYSFTYLCMDLV